MRAAVLLALALLTIPVATPAQESGEIVASPIRDVTPPGATRPPAGPGPLTREQVPPPPPEPARWRRFFLPASVDAATFRADRLVIRISGVAAPTAAAVCAIDGGQTWPCGRTALASLRLFLRGRAIECYFPWPDGVEEVVAPCRLGTTDLGGWLLEQGWAKPDENATDEYRAASRAAACAGKGLWRGTSRPADCP